MKQLPLPVRVAAGLAVTAVDRARHLPEKLAELPVTVVSQALQLSMRLQQQVTELAIKGDDALATFRPVEETPEWARFDEDEPAEADFSPDPTRRNGAVSRFDAVGADDADDESDESLDAVMEGGARPDARPDADAAAIGGVSTGTGAEPEDDIADAADAAETIGVDAEATAAARSESEADAGVGDDAASETKADAGVGDDAASETKADAGVGDGAAAGTKVGTGIGDSVVVEDGAGADEDANEVGPETDGIEAGTEIDDAEAGAETNGDTADSDADGDADGDPWAEEQRALADVHVDGEFDSAPPTALPSYPDLSVPQLRARLRRLTEQDLTELLDYERAHGNRPEYAGMLTRRIATVRDQQ